VINATTDLTVSSVFVCRRPRRWFRSVAQNIFRYLDSWTVFLQ